MRYIAACTLLLFFCGCPDDGIKPSTNPLQLTVEDATCTEVFIKLSLPASEQNRTVTLTRNDSTFATIVMANNDSLFVDEGLLPKKTYTYTLAANNWSVTAQATTMDTTSHNWSYTLDTLGESNSYLLDVAIINDTLAYAVGEIHIGDTLYNAAKWNGTKWELMRLPSKGSVAYPPLQSVLVISSNNILFSWGGGIITFDGINFTDDMRMNPLLTGAINKLFAFDSQNIYAVGGNGSIVHFNGNNWQKQESGTTLALTGIKKTSDNQLYACGIHYGQSKGVVLRKTEQGWQTIIEGDIIDSSQLFKPKLLGITEGLWIDEKNTLYTVGNLIYQYRSGIWSLVKSLAGNNFTGNPNFRYRGYLHAIDGNISNDIFIAGEINSVRHFNGVTWMQIGLPYHPLNYDMFWFGCNVKNNIAIVVGKTNGRASILTAKR